MDCNLQITQSAIFRFFLGLELLILVKINDDTVYVTCSYVTLAISFCLRLYI